MGVTYRQKLIKQGDQTGGKRIAPGNFVLDQVSTKSYKFGSKFPLSKNALMGFKYRRLKKKQN